jgi:PAS domain S-box-containing protein
MACCAGHGRRLEALIKLTQLLADTRDVRSALAAGATCLAESLGASQCNIVRERSGERNGRVLATSGATEPAGVELTRLEEPIRQAGTALGVLELSFAGTRTLTPEEAALVEGAAQVFALVLARADAEVSAGPSAPRSVPPGSFARAEIRIKALEPYVQFFEGAPDGMLVIDHRGRLLFSNPRARGLTGYSEADLREVRIQRFLSRRELAKLSRVVRGLGEGVYPHGVDICVPHKAGHELVLSVSFSSVLSEESALLLTFRDVTLERKTEVELRRATEFLHRVIDSSVDAIVAADMRGRVLLFNRAAARIFGYEPSEVIGKMHVERLYPPGVAREVMRKIRSPNHGGRNRLEDYRVDMLGSNGEPIPVNISAALMMEHDKPMGSVGVFTDVREKLRMEQRLSKAQEDLRQQERSLALAELAGTTAHELNQPLTGVIGYAELLLKRLDTGSPMRGAAEVILSESERMAEIVRKIGKITKYETRSYVGGVNILDLEKAAPNVEDIE